MCSNSQIESGVHFNGDREDAWEEIFRFLPDNYTREDLYRVVANAYYKNEFGKEQCYEDNLRNSYGEW